MNRRLGAVALALGVLALGVLALPAPPAAAADPAPSPQTRRLCTSTTVACSVQVDPVRVEGTSGEVAVTGAPRTEVGVRAFRVTVDGAGRARLRPYGPAVRVRTDGRGFGVGDLRLPVVPPGESGGPVLVALEDSAGPSLAVVLGAWSVLASRSPLVLGDGFAQAKPVGASLSLELASAVPGSTFDVELERDGRWEPVGATTHPCARAGTCVAQYRLPRGLAAREHRVRLVHRSSGLPVASWSVLPTDAGRPADRADVVTPAVGDAVAGSLSTSQRGATVNPVPRPRARTPEVAGTIAAAVDGAAGPDRRRPEAVRRAALGITAVALLGALVACLRGVRRDRDLSRLARGGVDG